MKNTENSPVSRHLLWEYDLTTFDFDRSRKVVIERVIERGSLEDWRWMVGYYGQDVVLEVAQKSKQLSKKDRNFTGIFLKSTLLDGLS